MFIDRILNDGSTPVLEQMLQFTAARHSLIAENVVNLSTPNYRQKDLSLENFQRMLSRRIDERRDSGGFGGAGFDDIRAEVEEPRRGVLFHDGANRSAEQLMSDQAKNALMHQVAIEMLRKQFQTLEMAIKGQP